MGALKKLFTGQNKLVPYIVIVVHHVIILIVVETLTVFTKDTSTNVNVAYFRFIFVDVLGK